MPELPEVETVRRTLSPALGLTIADVWSGREKLRQRALDRKRLRSTIGSKIAGLRRRGKYLLLDLKPSSHTLLVHLGMSGRFRLVAAREPRAPHTHVVFSFEAPSKVELRYSDPRRFGQVLVLEPGEEAKHKALAALGPDPLEDRDAADDFYERVHGSARSIKTLLLDQHVIAGVGNIYAAEALYGARIHPGVRGNKLSRKRATLLFEQVTKVMNRALDHGGTSLRDFVAADGAYGVNADYLQVYGRDGESCLRRGCAGTIRRRNDQGRGTFYCPSCQVR